MKKLLFISLLFVIGGLPLTSTTASAQDVFGQQAKSNTLAPVEIGYDELPEPVLKVLKQRKYTGWTVDKVYKVGTRKAQRVDHYTIRFRTGKGHTDVYLNEEGHEIDPQDEEERTPTKP